MNSPSDVAGSTEKSRTNDGSFWVDGGLLHGWAVVHSRLAHPLGTGDQQARYMFTKNTQRTATPLIDQWLDHLDTLGVAAADRESARVFWRLAVRQRSIALHAQPSSTLADAIESARQVSRNAASLTVRFGFFPDEPIPKWVVLAEGVPVFVGLPQHHLVRVSDPRASLAALVAAAHTRTKVHQID